MQHSITTIAGNLLCSTAGALLQTRYNIWCLRENTQNWPFLEFRSLSGNQWDDSWPYFTDNNKTLIKFQPLIWLCFGQKRFQVEKLSKNMRYALWSLPSAIFNHLNKVLQLWHWKSFRRFSDYHFTICYLINTHSSWRTNVSLLTAVSAKKSQPTFHQHHCHPLTSQKIFELLLLQTMLANFEPKHFSVNK